MDALAVVGFGAGCVVLAAAAVLDVLGVRREPFVEWMLTGLMLWVMSPAVVLLLSQGRYRLLFLLVVVAGVVVSLFLPGSRPKAWWTCLCVSAVGMGWWLFAAGD